VTPRDIAERLFYGLLWPAFHVRPMTLLRGVPGRPRWLARLPVYGEFVVGGLGVVFRYRGDVRDMVGRDLFWGGLAAVEPETVEFALSRVDGRTLFIDAGANCGVFSLAAAAKGAALVIAAEPVPHIFAALEANLAANPFDGRCRALPVALGAGDGDATLTIPPVRAFATSSSLLAGGWRGTGGETLTVPLRRLDGIVEELSAEEQARIDRVLVKIDVEGAELQVLEGATGLLDRPGTGVIFEANDDTFLVPVRAFLEARGFAVQRITAEGLVPVDAPDRPARAHERNFFAER